MPAELAMTNNPHGIQNPDPLGQGGNGMYISFSQENLQISMTVIENEFKVPWLVKHCRYDQHPVPKMWNTIKENFLELNSYPTMENIVSQKNVEVIQNVYDLHELSRDILSVSDIPNYESEIKPRLSYWKKFQNVRYEIHVASVLKSVFERVEFVPRSTIQGERTADLLVYHENVPFLIECTQTKPFLNTMNKMNTTPLDKKLIGCLNRIIHTLEGNWNAYLISLRASLESKILEEIKSEEIKLRNSLTLHNNANERGNLTAIDEALQYGLWFEKFPDMSPENNPSLSLDMVIKNGEVVGTFEEDGEGKRYFKNVKRVGIYNLDALKIKTILNKIEDKFKKKQTEDCSPGIVFMDLDLSKLNPATKEIFYKLLSFGLGIYFKSRYAENIGLVAFTTKTTFIESPNLANCGFLYDNAPRKPFFVKNIHCSLPSNFPLFENSQTE